MNYILYWYDSAKKERVSLRFVKREDAQTYLEEHVIPNEDIDFWDIYVPESEYLSLKKTLENKERRIALAINELQKKGDVW